MKRAFAVTWLLLLVACAQLGLPEAKTFDQRLAVGYAGVTAVRQSTLTLLQAKRISPVDAQNVQRQADNVREALDIARALRAGSPQGAEDKLSAAVSALTVLQRYVQVREKR